MTSNPLQLNLSRSGGCTLTGALSVTTQVRDAVTIIHGPKGCTHHNFSLLHATAVENDRISLPDIISTGLSESDIIFGGEGALRQTLDSAPSQNNSAIFVLSTCLVETIGDDVAAVCSESHRTPVIQIPTAGFLGGTFQNGVNNALNAIADTAERCPRRAGVNIIGEKNLEYEVEENYAEVCRLLGSLGIPVNVRFIRDCSIHDISRLGAARLNILRDGEVRAVGEHLQYRFDTPFIPSFPVGFAGTIQFLEEVADFFGVKCTRSLLEEKSLQDEILTEFKDIAGASVSFDPASMASDTFPVVYEVAGHVGVTIDKGSPAIPLQVSPPVGTNGIRHMLHRWRRSIHA